MFHCLPDSAWAGGNLAEAAGQLDNMLEHPTKVHEQMGYPVDTSLKCMRCSLMLVNVNFAEENNAEVGQNGRFQ